MLLKRHVVQSDMGHDHRITIHRFVQAAAQARLKAESKEVLDLVLNNGMKTCREYVPLARYAGQDARLLARELVAR